MDEHQQADFDVFGCQTTIEAVNIYSKR